MDALAVSYLKYLQVEKGLSSNTVAAYGRDLKRFSAYLEKNNLRSKSLTRDEVVQYLAHLYQLKLDSRSVARHLVSLRGFYKFLLIEDVIKTDPTLTLESPKFRRTLPTFLRLDEVEKLLQLPDVNKPEGSRDRALLELLYSSGLRVSELTSLRVSDVDFRTGTVRCVGKGDKERLVPIGRRALSSIEQYLQSARPLMLRARGDAPPRAVPLRQPAGQPSEPHDGLEDAFFLWPQGGPAPQTHAPQDAPQFCDASAGRRRGFAFRAVDAGARGHLHDANLYARRGRTVETSL